MESVGNELLCSVFLPRTTQIFEKQQQGNVWFSLFMEAMTKIPHVNIQKVYDILKRSSLLCVSTSFTKETLFNLMEEQRVFFLHVQNFSLFFNFSENKIRIDVHPLSNVRDIYTYLIGTNNAQINVPSNSILVSTDKILENEYFFSPLVALQSQFINEFEDLTKWLLPALDGESNEFFQITKKIKDEARMHNGTYWRRNGLYISMKYILHHQMIEEVGEEKGEFIYKLLILSFHSVILRKVDIQRIEYGLFNDIVLKIKIRVEKLRNKIRGNEIFREFEAFINKIEQKIHNIYSAKKELFSSYVKKLPSTATN